jgi:hypothetical protein
MAHYYGPSGHGSDLNVPQIHNQEPINAIVDFPATRQPGVQHIHKN